VCGSAQASSIFVSALIHLWAGQTVDLQCLWVIPCIALHSNRTLLDHTLPCTVLWPCRDAVVYLLFAPLHNRRRRAGTEIAAAPKAEPPPRDDGCRGKVITALLWAASSAVAMFLTDAMDVLEVVGAGVSSVVAFVLPFACFTQLRHGQLSPARRWLTTVPGVCTLLGVALTVGATYNVLRGLVGHVGAVDQTKLEHDRCSEEGRWHNTSRDS
jgi:hypothetical protein